MSKAFDSVDHQILLRKIQRVGASTGALKWFNSYLTYRYQVVRIHSSVSDPLPVECCVPQGSILGPLLFSIYLNDLPEVPRQCSTECYVDDTKLFVSFTALFTNMRTLKFKSRLHNCVFRCRHTKQIEIHQSQITNLDLLKPLK